MRNIHRYTAFAFAFLILLHVSAKVKNVKINELMPANVSFLLDDTYNYGAWIELYNTDDTRINLAGYSLTDELGTPRKFVFPENTGYIEPLSFKLLFFDNNDLNGIHINFKPDCDGAKLYLFSKDTVLLDEVEYGYSYPNMSYARKSNGAGSWATCISPTPCKSNSGSEFSYLRADKPQTNVAPGIYTRSFVMNLKAASGVVRYTTDGSEPDENSKIWSGYQVVASTSVIRARTFKKGYIPSEILTCSYIIDNTRKFDLPVISIVTDPDNFWNDTIGIYCTGTNGVPGNSVSYPANWNMEWRRPVNVEFFNGAYSKYFSQQCDVSIGGGWSRAYPEKSLELNAEKKYEGRNSFDNRFFVQKPYFRFKSLYLRNSGNDYYRTMFADAMQQCFYAGIVDVDYQAYQPALHYINGEYYGIINIRERSNHHYVYSNWGYDKDSIDLIEQHDKVAFNGDMEALNKLLWYTNYVSSSTYYYNKVLSLIDVDEFINYLIIETYSANSDWMSNNVKFYRNRNNGRFRWILFDLDFGFRNVDDNTFTSSGAGLSNNSAYSGQIFQRLKNNANFVDKFINHATAITGGAMRYERVSSIIDSIAELVNNEMEYHKQRWGNSYNIKSYVSGFKNFAKKRQYNYIKYLGDYFSLGEPVKVSITSNVKASLYINGVEVPTGKFDGYMNKKRDYKLSVEVPYGYKFKRWDIASITNVKSETLSEDKPDVVDKSNNMAKKPDLYSKEMEFMPVTNEYVITAHFEKMDTIYDHLVPAVRINELSANKGFVRNDYFEKSDWVELYNNTDTVFDLAGLYISNKEDTPKLFKIPCGMELKTTIPPYGYAVLWADEEEHFDDLHLPFKLSANGGRLLLSAYADDDSTLLWRDEIVFTGHDEDRSFGRYPDGGDKLYIMHRPTPAMSNLYSSYNSFVANDTVSGYQIENNKTTIENIEEVFAIIDITYYNLSGQEVGDNIDDLPFGVYVRRTMYANGTVRSEKVIKKR